MSDEPDNPHAGAEVHIGIGLDKHDDLTVDDQIIVMLHCPVCGNLEFQFPLAHFPAIAASLMQVAATIGLPMGEVIVEDCAHSNAKTLAEARVQSQDRYNKRRN